jgi:hypothetical protein
MSPAPAARRAGRCLAPLLTSAAGLSSSTSPAFKQTGSGYLLLHMATAASGAGRYATFTTHQKLRHGSAILAFIIIQRHVVSLPLQRLFDYFLQSGIVLTAGYRDDRTRPSSFSYRIWDRQRYSKVSPGDEVPFHRSWGRCNPRRALSQRGCHPSCPLSARSPWGVLYHLLWAYRHLRYFFISCPYPRRAPYRCGKPHWAVSWPEASPLYSPPRRHLPCQQRR